MNLNVERASEEPNVRMEGAVNENVEIVPRLKESDADAMNLESSGLDTRSKRGKSLVEDGELAHQAFTKLFKGSGSGEVKEDEKKGKKRKRSIMSDDQMEMMEKAIADEPLMQRDSAWIRTWAEKLNQNVSSQELLFFSVLQPVLSLLIMRFCRVPGLQLCS